MSSADDKKEETKQKEFESIHKAWATVYGKYQHDRTQSTYQVIPLDIKSQNTSNIVQLSCCRVKRENMSFRGQSSITVKITIQHTSNQKDSFSFFCLTAETKLRVRPLHIVSQKDEYPFIDWSPCLGQESWLDVNEPLAIQLFVDISMTKCAQCKRTMHVSALKHHETMCVDKRTCGECKQVMTGQELEEKHKLKNGLCPEFVYPCKQCQTPLKAAFHDSHIQDECPESFHPDSKDCVCYNSTEHWKRKNWPTHALVCPTVKVNCLDCKEQIRRLDLIHHGTVCLQKQLMKTCKCCSYFQKNAITLTRIDWVNHDCYMECLLDLSRRLNELPTKK